MRPGVQETDQARHPAPLFPLVPILAFSLCVVPLIGLAFDPNQLSALYFGIPFVGACYAFFYLKYGRRKAGQPPAQGPGRGAGYPIQH